ncbi:MAG TPA: bifunctional DNA-binding transcriptional regulator/O6-methylguanine-DNA methyltransferase Ada [Thermoanaerobaculia bacterium]|nr:bifunctional DNA-binding transcriptional regulator/O6-methylguanine-DNA methyltransferase Ada [Thermoanaerobaculia bacterium]
MPQPQHSSTPTRDEDPLRRDAAMQPPAGGQQPLDDEQRWEAVTHRDASFDGRFFLGVLTTGIYCRPSCPARRPLRKNVRFYATPAEAQRDGLRACLRCKPDQPAATGAPAWVAELCDHIRREADGGAPLTLAALAARVHLSPTHLQRAFRAAVGVSPRRYAELCRLERLKGELRQGESVTGAIYAAGFGSSSRVYERADSRLGMTPSEYKTGGRGVAITYAAADTSVGKLLLAATDRGLCFVQLGGSERELVARLRREYPAAEPRTMDASSSPAFAAWMEALRRHVEEGRPHGDLPVDVRASAFQQRVWTFLQSIPWGETRSYAQVAAGIGAPRASRAVARACATNPVAVAIPCHRVIRGDGGLSGYRWGTERKRRLLDRERAASMPDRRDRADRVGADRGPRRAAATR